MLTYPNVLLLTSDAGEAAELQRLLSRYVVLTCAGTLGELLELLENGRYDALFCAWSFDSGTWNEALQEVQKRYPGIPLIVLSPCGAEHEWLEVLDAGAFDLLARLADVDDSTLAAALQFIGEELKHRHELPRQKG